MEKVTVNVLVQSFGFLLLAMLIIIIITPLYVLRMIKEEKRMEENKGECRNCRRPLHYMEGVGWLHGELPQYANENLTCERAHPVDCNHKTERCPRNNVI